MSITRSPLLAAAGPVGAGYYLWNTAQDTLDALWSWITQPELFGADVPLPNTMITASAPQTQQQLKGAWSPAQRAEVDRAKWESGKLDMLAPLPSIPARFPDWILPVAVGLGAFLLIRR